MIDIEAERKICEAATKGPWRWTGYLSNQSINLISQTDMRPVVMGFGRWGMQGAQPKFSDDGIMEGVQHFAEADHNTYLMNLNHPNAIMIEHARTALPAALDEIERLRGIVLEAINLFDSPAENCYCDGDCHPRCTPCQTRQDDFTKNWNK